MRATSFALTNVLGSVYERGPICFTPDGSTLLSPTGNRLTLVNLQTQASRTLPVELRRTVANIALNPARPYIAILIDVDGRAVLVNLYAGAGGGGVALAHINFGAPVRAVRFTPDGKHLAVAHGSQIKVWQTPSTLTREFSPFVLHRTYTGHDDDVLSIQWSPSGQFFLTTSKDLSARLYSLDPIPFPSLPGTSTNGKRQPTKFRPKTFSGHRASVLSAHWSADERTIYTIGKDGSCFVWRIKPEEESEGEDEEEDADSDADGKKNRAGPSTVSRSHDSRLELARARWGIAERHYFNAQSVGVNCADYHPESSLLVVGFVTGVFGLYTLADEGACTPLHTLSISSEKVAAVTFSPDGAWLAFGCAGLGQLLVWEWASESYILKQQGHYADVRCIAYSNDGQIAATGGDDGKVKLWNTTSGFCTATFTEHSATVAALEFASKGQVLFSASLDGTVRAWDLLRYRNFRTFTSPEPVQFGCLAVEPSGEVVAAGGGGAAADSFDIFTWNVQSGKILDVMGGHDGPVASLTFSPSGSGQLISASWDKTLKVWEAFRDASADTVGLTAEATCVAFRPDGGEICVATLDGQINFFDPRDGAKQLGILECRKDIAAGRRLDDKVTRQGNEGAACFTSLHYSADGRCVLAGGNSNWICLYDVRERVLLKRWTVSKDVGLDNTQDRLDSRRLTAAGPRELIDDISDEDELTTFERLDKSLPGAQRGDMSKRTTRKAARITSVRFSPTGRAWAAASTVGVLVYSLDPPTAAIGVGAHGGAAAAFDPLDLDMELTPASIIAACARGESLGALVGALRLGEAPLLAEVYEKVPVKEVPLVASQLPQVHVGAVLKLVAQQLHPQSNSPHVEFHLRWLAALLTTHGAFVRKRAKADLAPSLRLVAACLYELRANVKRTADENLYALLHVWDGMQRKGADQA
ncbi:WD40 repeat-like protein [Ceraceosorus guamensis]|uniref:WD40 repeat-like protein n=1 Tax=Ceraceosorus guamensis TaxID=1522189 RepID=A0A316W4Y4_9BASI|nr:WD40 repeat-like protein [Ceraceosorus guamensis]PWN44960.1 WD40 repeat-like protein [Ceraceosorus guamensis]